MTDHQDAVWIERCDIAPGNGPIVAVKDMIDVAGAVTTAGCRAIAMRKKEAARDAICVSRVKEQGGRIGGKTNLHELAFGVTGVNPWFGTPPNPVDPGHVPGGSSSGSAVAVALGDADIALGTDTAGSVRIPAACCGVVGLKTTHGRIPVDGVWPLAPSFDTVGPLARSVAGVISGMRLLEPGFEMAATAPDAVGRIDFGSEIAIDPVIDDAVDLVLRRAELTPRAVRVEGWERAWRDQQTLVGTEALASDSWLIGEDAEETIGADTLQRFRESDVPLAVTDAARSRTNRWKSAFTRIVESFGVLALPTLARRAPLVGERGGWMALLTAPVSLAGLPAIALPVAAKGRPPASLQLVAAAGREDLLLATATRIEESVSSA